MTARKTRVHLPGFLALFEEARPKQTRCGQPSEGATLTGALSEVTCARCLQYGRRDRRKAAAEGAVSDETKGAMELLCFTMEELRPLAEQLDAVARGFIEGSTQPPVRSLMMIWAASKLVNDKAEEILKEEFGASVQFGAWMGPDGFPQKEDKA